MTRSILPVVVLVGAGLVSAAPRAAKPAASPAKKDPAADINAPRPDARVVEFEAREGTWISVDVSPDGKAMAFDLLGDIYSMPIAGGEAHALTSGPAWDAQPRFSPDGTTIAFSSDRGGIENVWLMDADGGHPRPLTSEKDAYVAKLPSAKVSMGAMNDKCPLTGKEVNKNAPTANYNGKTIGFCCGGCAAKFEAMTDDQKAAKVASVMPK